MTVNTVSPVQSSPFTGLGTQTLNVTTTGLYTLSLNVTIPWMTSDQPQARANPPTLNVQTITAVADVAGSLNDTYFTFYTAGDLNGYYVWFNIASGGTDPEVEGLTGIEVAADADATATTLGGLMRTAVAAGVSSSLIAVTGATTALIITNKQYGACTAAADSVAATGFTFGVGTAGTYGYASGLSIVVDCDGDEVMSMNQPTPTQAFMAGSCQFAATAGDVVSVVLSSLSAADGAKGAVKGIFNMFLGE